MIPTTIMTRCLPPTKDGVAKGVTVLRQGGLLGFGTETVYGLGADATNTAAVRRIYAAKGRPDHNPLIIHVSSLEMAERYALFSPLALTVAARFWPGPLTLVLEARTDSDLSSVVRSDLPTVAIRFPTTSVAVDLISGLGRPIAAPSANLSGRISATTAAEVLRQLGGRIEAVIDSGPTQIGIESTILGLAGAPRLLRHGAVTAEDLLGFLGALEGPGQGSKIIAPGQLASHYAPKSAVRMNVLYPGPGELWIGFGPCAGCALSLSPSGNLDEAAGRLFTIMAEADDRLAGKGVMAFAPIPSIGLGRAINDRLFRAMAPRSNIQRGEELEMGA